MQTIIKLASNIHVAATPVIVQVERKTYLLTMWPALQDKTMTSQGVTDQNGHLDRHVEDTSPLYAATETTGPVCT